jgi:hypothetical protein
MLPAAASYCIQTLPSFGAALLERARELGPSRRQGQTRGAADWRRRRRGLGKEEAADWVVVTDLVFTESRYFHHEICEI